MDKFARPPRPSQLSAPNGQRGVALLEALVALLIMSFGMLALAGLQGNLRQSADLAKQRGEAVRLGQQEMERLRSFSQLPAPNPPNADVRAFEDITEPPNGVAGTFSADTNTTFTVTRQVTDIAEPPQKALRINVSWTDRTEGAQFIILDSILSRTDPILGGGLAMSSKAPSARQPSNRDANIPTPAKDLGNGSSAFKPLTGGDVVWVFNNLTGVITGVCNIPATPMADLVATDVDSCKNNTLGYLLSGFVRFSDASPSDPGKPTGLALPMDLNLALTQSSALTPSYQCFNNAPITSPSTQTFVTYYCIVYPNADTPPIWSGQLTLTDIPLSGIGARTICRYSADYDANGSISNAEHPLVYSKVTGSLARQNFLVIPGTETCPAGHDIDPAQGFFSNTATVRHQPNGI
ncbi:MAG: prepilin-type N-terminal cleavage/methylation domain-containing protein [Burkholderiaceae bacterium]|nr:prepilin-type N-terminal cleavage/methylation domain-containing protein [Burkholderiaceae bacterium]